jgi:HK97 family phage major capsid protein
MTEYRDAFRRYLLTGRDHELRAMGTTAGGSGGYLFAPEFREELAVQLQEYARVLADFRHVETSNGRPLNAPGAQNAPAATLATENPGSALSDVDRTFSQVQLGGYTVTSGIGKFSLQMEQDSGFEVDELVRDFAAESIGRGLSALSTAGTGSSQPTGVYVGAAAGQTVSLTAATAVTLDGSSSGITELGKNVLSPASWRALMQKVDTAYWDGAKFYMNTTQYANLLATTDSTGQPLVRPNGPRELHGFPIVVANEISNLTASTVSGPVFGNLQRGLYWRDAGIEILRLKERFADVGQTVAFVCYTRSDFKVRDANAFAVLKPAAT